MLLLNFEVEEMKYEQYSIYGELPYTLAYDTDLERSNYLKKLI